VELLSKKVNSMLKLNKSDITLKQKWSTSSSWKKTKYIVAKYQWIILFCFMGLMLGRATILDGLMCCALAFYAISYHFRKETGLLVALSLIAGNLLSLSPQPLWLALQLTVTYLLFRAFREFERLTVNKIPLIVFSAVVLVQLFNTFIGDQVTWFNLMMVFVEAALSFVLAYVFLYALPVLMTAKPLKKLKNEELICMFILLACLITGMTGWSIEGLGVERIFSFFILLVFAIAGGAAIGASVGIVMGLILSLADFSSVMDMSILAFAGLLAGLLREGGKMASAFGLLLGTSILTLYMGSQQEVLKAAYEIGLAVILVLMTPKGWFERIAKWVPGTYEYAYAQYESTKKVRQLTAEKINHYANMFKQLSSSFYPQTLIKQTPLTNIAEYEMHDFIERVAENTCIGCRKYKSCWGEKAAQTHTMMREMMLQVEQVANDHISIKPSWNNHCVATEDVASEVLHQYKMYVLNEKWKNQLKELTGIVADQLQGVSEVMMDLSQEINKEGQALHKQEEQIKEAIEELGLHIHAIDIINLEVGQVEIEIQHSFEQGFDESRKIIAPILSSILGEHITVKHEEPILADGSLYKATFTTAKQYETQVGVAAMAKNGDILSGDSFSMVELDNGKFAVAISDGMGNGNRARIESSTALNLLQQLLQAGMNEKLAVKSVNSILLLRSPDEMYATVDLAIIDLYTAETTFMKIGSTPSYIKRGHDIIPVMAHNLPIGIVEEFDVESIRVPLQAGDILIMMSDGIYDAPGYAVNKDLWIKRNILEIDSYEAQDIADQLLERVLRHHNGEIKDDMTVVVTRIDTHLPEWTAFRWQGLEQINRTRHVS